MVILRTPQEPNKTTEVNAVEVVVEILLFPLHTIFGLSFLSTDSYNSTMLNTNVSHYKIIQFHIRQIAYKTA